MGRTLIIARRTQAEPKTALAGVMLEISFARLRVSMATFNAERRPSRSLEGLDVGAIAETRGNSGRVRREGCVKNPEPRCSWAAISL